MNNFLKLFLFLPLILAACSSIPKRNILDSSGSKPDWVSSSKTVWEKDGVIHIRSTQTIKGNERINGCYDLAKLQAREDLLSEISVQIKGAIDNAQQSISEDAENLLGKVRSGKFEGEIVGLRFSEQYFERYKIEDTERQECFVYGQISKEDYNKTKRSVVDKIKEVDPRLKEAITQKQIEFFK